MANNLRELSIAVTTDGSGDAEGFSDGEVTGIVRRITAIRSGADSGSLIEVFLEGVSGAPDVSILDLTAGDTDVSFNPKIATHTGAGAAISGGYTDVYAFGQRLKVDVASGGDTLPLEFRILVEELEHTI